METVLSPLLLMKLIAIAKFIRSLAEYELIRQGVHVHQAPLRSPSLLYAHADTKLPNTLILLSKCCQAY